MHRSVNLTPAGKNPLLDGTVTAVLSKAACVLSAALVLVLVAPAQRGHAQEVPDRLDEIERRGPPAEAEVPGPPGDAEEPGSPGGAERPDQQDVVFGTGLILTPPNELARFPQAPLHRGPLPPVADLRRYFPPAGNQGRQGSCTGWAAAYARSYYRFWAITKRGASPTWRNIASPAYIYNSIHGGWCNSGSSIPNALRVLLHGAAAWPQFPYSQKRCSRLSNHLRQRVKGRYRIGRFWRVNHRDINQVKAQLAKGHPVVVGMFVNKRFQRLGRYRPYSGKEWWKNYVWRAGYARDEEKKFGHAMVLNGYWGGQCQCFGVHNSWGQRWGNKGRAFISYDTFRKRTHSAFVIRPQGIGINQRIR